MHSLDDHLYTREHTVNNADNGDRFVETGDKINLSKIDATHATVTFSRAGSQYHSATGVFDPNDDGSVTVPITNGNTLWLRPSATADSFAITQTLSPGSDEENGPGTDPD